MECNICNTNERTYLLPCCKDKYICETCVSRVYNCPYCRQRINVETNYIRKINKDKLLFIFSILIGFLSGFINVYFMDNLIYPKSKTSMVIR